jgi:CheY-like chemotaxis protein
MRPCVLVVDGSSERAELMRETLEARGLDVEAIADGPGALSSLDSRRPDVVLLDADTPGMSGMEILDRIRSSPQHAGLPVILVGEQASDEDLFEGYKFGADYFLSQPLTSRRLLYAVGLVLGREFPE